MLCSCNENIIFINVYKQFIIYIYIYNDDDGDGGCGGGGHLWRHWWMQWLQTKYSYNGHRVKKNKNNFLTNVVIQMILPYFFRYYPL